MLKHEDQLIETAVKPFADHAEMRLGAMALLEKHADTSRAGREEAISRWIVVDSSRKSPLWKWSFVGALLALSLWAWSVAGMEALVYRRLDEVSFWFRYDSYSSYPESVKMLDECLPAHLTFEQRRLLVGDITKQTRVEAMKALWDSTPDDPAFYMEYAASVFLNERSSGLPSDFLERARKLDPGNAWPIYMAGSMTRSKVVEPIPRTQAEIAAKVIPSWKILDQQKLDDCLILFHEASRLPRFDTYQSRLNEMRKGLIPVDDHLSYLTAGKVLWMDDWGNTDLRAFLQLYLLAAAAKSEQLVAQNDAAGLATLINDVQILNERWVSSEIGDWHTESNYSGIGIIPGLHRAAVTLGLEKEAGSLAMIMRRLEISRSEVDDDLTPETLEARGSFLFCEARRYFVYTAFPARETAQLKPGRMADYALLSRGCCLILWIIFGLGTAVVALYRFRLSLLIRRLGIRFEQLLDVKDRLWIMGGGLLLPFVYTMGIIRLTPSGGRDWGIYGNRLMLPMAQYLGMAFLMLIVPVLVIRWRLGKKAGYFGLAGKRSWWGILSVVGAALSIPFSGWFAHLEPDVEWSSRVVPLAFFWMFSLLWLLSNSLRVLFMSSERHLLRGAVVSRSLIPVYASVMLVTVVAAPIHKAAERAWFRRDTTMTAVPGFPAVSPYDYQVAKEMRREIREILGYGE